MKVKNIKLEKQIEGSPLIKENTAYNILNFGAKNDYPFQLLELFNESPIHHSCVEFAVKAIVGNGINKEKLDGDTRPSANVTWDEFFENISLDYVLYGSFAIEVIKNKDDKTYSYFHVPFEKVRFEKPNEEGRIEHYLVSDDWSAIQKNPITSLKSFFFYDDEDLKKNEGYLYVYTHYSPSSNYYSIPSYIAALKAIQADVAYNQFELRSITNSFVPSGAVILPYVESDQEREEIIREFQQSLVGENNSNNVMFAFKREADEANPVDFVPFNASTNNVDLYESANNRVIDRITSAHRIPSKGLIGLSLDATGFSDDGNLIQTALKIYMENVGLKNRSVITTAINNLMIMNGVETEIEVIDLNFRTLSNETNINSEDTSNENNDANVGEEV